MSSWFDRFADFDKVKEQAESLWHQSVRETKRQAALVRIRTRLALLEQRSNKALRELGKKVWDLHCDDALTKDGLTGAFDTLEAIADEMEEARADLETVRNAKTEAEIDDALADDPPAAPDASDDGEPAVDDEPERNLE